MTRSVETRQFFHPSGCAAGSSTDPRGRGSVFRYRGFLPVFRGHPDRWRLRGCDALLSGLCVLFNPAGDRFKRGGGDGFGDLRVFRGETGSAGLE